MIVQLQLFVSATAVNLLIWLGSDVVRDGNVIRLPTGDELFVAEACSGITSIVTLTPLAVMFAYFTESRLARRAAIVVAVVPLAMLGNLLRVSATVAAAERYGVDVATGNVLHEFAGLITFVLASLALIALGSLMKRLAPVDS
jgi:exosortase